MKTRTALAGIMMLIGTSAALADNSSTVAAEKLTQAMGMDKMLDAAIDQKVDAQIKLRLELSGYKDVMTKFYKKYMSYDSLKPDLISMYSQTFSKKEMDEIAAFYNSPTGKRVVEKMPDLIGKVSKLGADRADAHLDEMVMMIKANPVRLRPTM